ncbi:MAG: hypothetical protein ACYC9O_20095, partial [Candidatus Latescibacterota bacterium]
FLVWMPFEGVNQLAVQTPAAALISVAIIVFWMRFLMRYLPDWALQERREYALAYLAAFFWNPLIFTSIHYVTEGYLTSLGNILALAVFQLPVNFIALFAVLVFEKK